MLCGILHCDIKRGPRYVRCKHASVRSIHCYRNRNTSCARTEVDDQRRGLLRFFDQLEHALDKELGLGPRDQHIRSDNEIEAVELLMPGDVLKRFARGPAID